MTTTTLEAPPLTGRQLVDYRDMPGYAIPPDEPTTETETNRTGRNHE